MGLTLFEKVWESHIVRRAEGLPDLLYVDLHLVHEVTSPQAFEGLRRAGRSVRRPQLTLATVDHNVPTGGRAGASGGGPQRTLATVDHNVPTGERSLPLADPVAALQLDALGANADEFG